MKPFIVRVNRVILFLIMVLAGLFILTGLDMVYFRSFFTLTIEPGKEWVFYVFVYLICFGMCGVVAVQMFLYLFVPPVMLRLDEQGVTFGVGMRYRPFLIPWNAVESVGYGVDIPTMTTWSQLKAGAMFVMRQLPGVPSWKATGAGLGYGFYRLHFDWKYADRLPTTIVREGRAFLERYGTPAQPEKPKYAPARIIPSKLPG